MYLTKTGAEVYVATAITVIPGSCAYLVETVNHMNSLKLKDHTGDNVKDWCDAILVYYEHLGIAGAFNTKHLRYIIRIF